MGMLALVAGVAAIGVTGVATASCLRLRSAVSFVLAVFVVAWAVLVVETMLLSVLEAWTRASMLVTLVLGAVVSVVTWSALGRQRPQGLSTARNAARNAFSDPIVALLGGAAILGFGYLVVIGVVVPPGNWDELLYHLPRMVLWIQQDAVAAIPDAPGSTLDASPIAAEIPQALTLLLEGSDRFVALFQLASLPIACLAIAGIAHRLGIPPRGAVFGALVFALLPAVALQAPTAYNDLALATALVVAAYFALGRGRGELVLFGLATALAVGTKVSGLLALPALALFVLVATTGRRRVEIVVAGLAGAALGSWWYAYNLVRTGTWHGGLTEEYNQVPSRAPDDILLRLQRYTVDLFDLSGVVGDDRFVFPIVAVVVLVVGLLLRRPLVAVGAAALVAIAPWLVAGLHDVLVRAVSRAWIVVGRDDMIGFFPAEPATKASTPEAWFGPALALLVLSTTAIVAVRTTGRKRLVYLTASLGAPLLLALTNAAAFTWDPGRGRFFLFAAALAATTFGLLLRVRAVAAGLAAVAVVALLLSLVHYRGRAMGIELLQPVDDLVAWSAPRWEVQSAFSRDHPEVGEALRVVEEEVPADATIAIGRSVQMPLYHVMGGGPWRRTVFVRPDGSVPDEAEWVALPLFVDLPLDPSTWRLLDGTGTGDAWRIYRRVD